MKIWKFLPAVVILCGLSFAACGGDEPNDPAGGDDEPGKVDPNPEDPGKDPEPTVKKTPTLLDKEGCTIDTIAPGIVYYNRDRQKDDVTGSPQIVNVTELDLTTKNYELDLRFVMDGKICSEVFKTTKNAVVSMNGGYELEAIYLKANNYKAATVTLAPDHLRYWKHEGAIYWSSFDDLGMVFAGKNGADALAVYNADKHRNLIASAPMLVDNYEPVGASFVPESLTAAQLNALDYEDPYRNCHYRRPRPAPHHRRRPLGRSCRRHECPRADKVPR